MEVCPSGRRRQFWKLLKVCAFRGFESLHFRHLKLQNSVEAWVSGWNQALAKGPNVLRSASSNLAASAIFELFLLCRPLKLLVFL